MSICLSRDEMRELTGATRKTKQLAVLRQNGIRHYVDAYGRPVVPRSVIEGDKDVVLPVSAWKPNKAA